jgi:secreted Zn-dependent insulinase-like peptidase
MNTSPHDKKEYRIVNTGEGGCLEALLVSTKTLVESSQPANDPDPEGAKAAAAMCVQVGTFSDPSEAEGLAHYLEHMVFMGSQKYPSENGYEQYVNNHGGGCNACTQGEFTVFQFDITAEYYTKALDMFANCFISPLLKMEAADRELKAIESEFAQASVSDDVRFQQIFSHNAADGHVLRKFSWGNMKSLSTVPQAKGVNMESMLRSFHRTHYLPQNMKLVVVAPKSLDAIEKDVKKCFGGWSASATHAQDDAIASLLQEDEKKAAGGGKKGKKQAAAAAAGGGGGGGNDSNSDSKKGGNCNNSNNKNSKKKKQKTEEEPVPLVDMPTQESILAEQKKRFDWQPVSADQAGTLTRVVPIKASHKLTMVWQLPSAQQDWRKKTHLYLAELIGHEGEGSIISYLKEIGYANYLSAGCDPDDNFENNSMFSLFKVLVNLTSKGLANWPFVTEVVMRYVNMLIVQGPQRWFYDELRSIQQLEFTYLDEEEEEDLAERLCMYMCPLYARERKELLGSSILLYEWDPEAISEATRALRPDNALVTVSSSSYRSSAPKASADEAEDDTAMSEEGSGDWEDASEEDGDEEEGDEDGGGEDGAESAETELSSEELQALYQGPAQRTEWLALGVPPSPEAVPELEPHFSTTFWREALPSSLRQRWQACYDGTQNDSEGWNKVPAPALGMPAANIYCATDLSVVEADSEALHAAAQTAAAALAATFHSGNDDAEGSNNNGNDNNGGKKKKKQQQQKKKKEIAVEPEPVPTRLVHTEGLRVFHLVDPRFPVPKAELFIRLSSPVACRDARSAALLDLVKGVLVDSLEQPMYVAALAGLSSSVGHVDVGLDFKFKGFSHKLPQLVLTVLAQLQDPESFITENRFSMQTEKIVRMYRNAGIKASALANSSRLQALKESTFSPRLRLEHIPTAAGDNQPSSEAAPSGSNVAPITREELVSFVQSFLADVEVDVLSHGNLSQDALQALVRTAFEGEGTLPSASAVPFRLREGAQPIETIVSLPPAPHTTILKQTPSKPDEPSIAVDIYYQLGPASSMVDVAALDAMEQMLDEPFFDLLRTKKQLGYSVSCSMRNTFGVLGFVFSVVSSSYSVAEVQREILSFAKEAPRLLRSMHGDDWADHIESMVSQRLQPQKNLFDAAITTAGCVADRRYDLFDTKKQDVAHLQALTKDSLGALASRLFDPKSRRMLSIQVSFEDEATMLADCLPGTQQRVITDPRELQGDAEVYTVRKMD